MPGLFYTAQGIVMVAKRVRSTGGAVVAVAMNSPVCRLRQMCPEQTIGEYKKNKMLNTKTNSLSRFTVLAVFFLCLFSFNACSKKTVEKTAEPSKKIVIGFDQFRPYSYINLDGNFTGIDVDIATLAFKNLGFTAEFKSIEWDKKDKLLENKTLDCIWSCFTMTDRQDLYTWAGPYLYSRQVVAVRTDSKIYAIKDLKDKRVAVQVTTKAESLFQKRTPSLVPIPQIRQLNTFSSTPEIFAMLRKSYVDAIAGHEALLSELIKNGNGYYRLLNESLYISELGVAFLKGTNIELAQKLTKELEKLKNDGTIDKIVESYGLNAQKVVWGK